MFQKGDDLFQRMDEDEKEPEVVESREMLAKLLGVSASLGRAAETKEDVESNGKRVEAEESEDDY